MARHFSYQDSDFDLGFNLTEQPDPASFQMHTHSTMELYYFCRGGGVFHVEGSAYPLESGDVLLMDSSESHYIELDPTQPYERITLHFSPQVLMAIDPESILLRPFIDRKPGKQNLYKPHAFRGGSARHYFDTMMRPEHTRVAILAGLIPLLYEISGSFSSHHEEDSRSGDTVLYRIVRYLNKNLDSPITLDDICQKFYISKSQLCRAFRDSTGTTVKQYLTIKRLIMAKQRIDAGEQATHVYLQCGFNDYSSFYRAFVKHFGYAPTKG